MNTLDQLNQAKNYLSETVDFQPEVGIILGTGLGGLVNEIEILEEHSYENIPNFPVSTVEGHQGKLIFGKLGGKKVMAMQGRFHFYEGYNMSEIVFPVRVMKLMGIKHLVVSNACGGVNPDYEIGDIMSINDHINLFPSNPLIGKNIDELGPRFPDMSEPYCRKSIDLVKEAAKNHDIKIQEGVYAGLTGPTLETPAEYQYVRTLGADVVGMSTVPEVIAAKHMGLNCIGFSIITDLGVPGKIIEVTHELVQEVAREAEPKMTTLIKEVISKL